MEGIGHSVLKDIYHDYPGLQRKLSNQEAKGLSRLIERRMQQQQSELISKVAQLEMSGDDATTRYYRAVRAMEKDAEKDKFLVGEYKRRFDNISLVLANKERRFEGKYEQALKQIEFLKEDLKKVGKAQILLQEENERKDAAITLLDKDIKQLISSNEDKSDYHDILGERSLLRTEMLKLKTEMEVLKTKNANILRELKSSQGELKAERVHNVTEVFTSFPTKTLIPRIAPGVRTVTDVLGNSMSTHAFDNSFGDSDRHGRYMWNTTYWCTDPKCRAGKDLMDCRAQLARMCQENTRLQHMLDQVVARGRAPLGYSDVEGVYTSRDSLGGARFARVQQPALACRKI